VKDFYIWGWCGVSWQPLLWAADYSSLYHRGSRNSCPLCCWSAARWHNNWPVA